MEIDKNIYGTIFVLAQLLFGVVVYLISVRLESRRISREKMTLTAFQCYLNPHFIKNTLQSVNWFILNNERERASDYLCDFSNLMEDLLEFSQQTTITLQDMLEFLDLYLKLQHLRYEDRFDYISWIEDPEKANIQVAKNINPRVFQLPPLLLQPFVENAIEHGLQTGESKGEIKIVITFEDQELKFMVLDNGTGWSSKNPFDKSDFKGTGIGIKNFLDRVKIIKKVFGQSIKVSFEDRFKSKENPGTKVTIACWYPLAFDPIKGYPTEMKGNILEA